MTLGRTDLLSHIEVRYNTATNVIVFPRIAEYGVGGAGSAAGGDVDLGAGATGTVTIKNPGGTTLVNAASVTITASEDKVTYTLDTTTVANWPLDENYTWELTITAAAGQVYYRHGLLDVVLMPFACHVTDQDFPPSIPEETGQTSFAWEIGQAFAAVVTAIRGHIVPDVARVEHRARPGLIFDLDAMNQAILHMAMEIVCENRMQQAGDRWDVIRQRHITKYNETMSLLFETMRYDYDEDGKLSDLENEIRPLRSTRLLPDTARYYPLEVLANRN